MLNASSNSFVAESSKPIHRQHSGAADSEETLTNFEEKRVWIIG